MGNFFDYSTWIGFGMVALALILYFALKESKKKDAGRTAGLILGSIGVLIIFASGTAFFTAVDTGDVGNVGDTGVSGAIVQPIGTLTAMAADSMSFARDEVDGTVKFYVYGTNPSDPLARTIDTITMTDGNGNTTAKKIMTNTEYVVVADGSTTYYDTLIGNSVSYDYIAGVDSQSQTFEYSAKKIGTIADLADETETTDYFGASATTYNAANAVTASGSTITYNETAGSEYFVHPMTISITGGNAGITNAVLCPVWDTTNPPEGNEYTSITVTRLSGNDLGIPSEVISYWGSESCIPLGDIPAGSYSKYNFAYTVAESNVDTNDDWKWAVDDMGDYLGKDLCLGTKATAQTENIDHTT